MDVPAQPLEYDSGPFQPQGVIPVPTGTVDRDVPCRKCAYNLRSLPVDGRCPECGTAVGYSTQGNYLRFSDPGWLDTLRRGVNLIIAGVVCVIGLIILTACIPTLIASIGVRELMLLLTAVGLLSSVLMMIGAWLLTTPDPSGLGEEEYGTYRKVIRVTLVIGIGHRLLETAQTYLPLPWEVFQAIRLIGIGVLIVSLVGHFAQLKYLSKLALRIPNPKLSARADFLIFALGIPLVLLIGMSVVSAMAGVRSSSMGGLGCFLGLDAIAVLIFGIMYLLMLEKFGKEFKAQAQIARLSWAGAQQ